MKARLHARCRGFRPQSSSLLFTCLIGRRVPSSGLSCKFGGGVSRHMFQVGYVGRGVTTTQYTCVRQQTRLRVTPLEAKELFNVYLSSLHELLDLL